MTFKKILKYLSILSAAIILLVVMTPVAQAHSDSTPPFEELVISYWPEYDNQSPNESVLILYQGSLPDDAQLPAKINLHIPKGSTVFAATVLDASGQLMKVPFTQEPAGEFDEITYEINAKQFQLELYHYPTGEGTNRTYDFTFRTSALAKTLVFEIQKPLAATDFKVEPAAAKVVTKQDASNNNFQYYSYLYNDIPEDRDFNFKVTYSKVDTKPSVSQVGTVASTSSGSTAGNQWVVLVILIGLVGVAVGITFTLRARKLAQTPVRAKVQTSKKGKPAQVKKKKFCGSCGAKIETDAKFCAECGSTTK